MTRLRRWFLARQVVQRALATPPDPRLSLGRPPPRVLAGLILLAASYLLGWPAVVALGALATWWKAPKLLLLGPPIYGLSWLIFFVGLALIGSKSMRAGRALLLLLVRRFAERFLLD